MPIYEKDLYQYSTHMPQIDLTFHQYLLLTSEPILFHTGSVQQTAAMIPQLKETLGGRNLKYIFVSHFESDECGGLSLLLEQYPDAKTICSESTARQLSGFGIINNAVGKKPGDKLSGDDFELEFISYPSEMHLWEGLLVMENKRKIFFSSDLMIRFGKEIGTVIEADWKNEVENIRPEQVPYPELRDKLQKKLYELDPKFIATGHGPCIKLK